MSIDRLETSFGEGRDHRPVDERLQAGRRALRRRRVVSTGATAIVVAGLVLTSAMLSQLRDTTQAGPSAPPSASAATLATDTPRPGAQTTIAAGHTYVENPIPREDSPVRFAGDELVAEPGARITVLDANPPYSSRAIPDGCTVRAAAVSDGPADFFVLGYTCPHGAWDLITETAGARADTLPAWLTAVKAAQEEGGEGVR